MKKRESTLSLRSRAGFCGKEAVLGSGAQGIEGVRPILASNLVGRLGTGGLVSYASPPNWFSKNVGIALPLNGNTEELLFLGEIRGV